MTESTILTIGKNGLVVLPEHIWNILLKASKIRSRKKRHIKKAVRKQFHKALYSYINSLES